MKLMPHLKIVFLLLTLCVSAQAQQPNSTPLHSAREDARIARLVGLAKVWGAVKYFHPFLAYREIDWDKALIETIPKVTAAATPQEYQAAINQMLAVLGDKSTRAEIESQKKSGSPLQTNAAVRKEDGVLVIEAVRIAKTRAQNPAVFNDFVSKISAAIPTAKGVVIDGREADPADDVTMWATAPRLTEKTMVVGSLFSRPLLEAPYLSNPAFAESATYSFAQFLPARQGEVYKGKVVMLINEDAFSRPNTHVCFSRRQLT